MAEVGVRAPPAIPGPGRWDGRHDNDLRNSERQGRARHRRQPGDRCGYGGAAGAGGRGCGRHVRGRQGGGLGRRTEGRGAGAAGAAPPAGRRGRRAVALRADSADAEEAGGAVLRTAEALGGLDVLVNNAGVGVLGQLGELSLTEVDRVLAVNVRGVFLASQAASTRMRDGGRIITIGSCMTQRVPGPGGTLYATSKSALTGLTKALARELGPRGITANIVHPGPTDTDMNPADGPFAAGQAAMTAVGRFGTAEEVASMVAYLADAAYVTGAEFSVDGGHAA